VFGLSGMFSKLRCARTSEHMDYQRELFWTYYESIQRLVWCLNFALRVLAPFAGVPTRQLALYPNPGYLTMLTHRVLHRTPWQWNYFYQPYVYGKMEPDATPLYLQAHHYNNVQSRLREPGRLTIVTSRMDLIQSDVRFNRYILLDHMDWMLDRDILQEWTNLQRNATADCLYCWRSFAMTQPFASLRHLTYHTSISIFDEKTHLPNGHDDRVAMYNSIHVAEIDGDLCKVTTPTYMMTTRQSASVFAHMLLQPLLGFGLNNRDFMNRYYKTQAALYDAYRSLMLHGKEPLMYAIPWHQMAHKKVLLLAGGTGDLTEYFATWIPCMDSVVISDISEPMIHVAKQRIQRNQWENVHARIEDILDDGDFQTDEAGTYDWVLLTYSLTMIPNWAKTIQKCIRYLKPGGKLAIADFTVTAHQSTLGRFFWRTLFATSHIYLNPYHITMLQTEMHEEYLRVDRGHFPHVPFLTCPYYYGIYSKK